MKAYIAKILHLFLRLFIRPTSKGGWPFIPFKHHLISAKIWKIFLSNKQQFGVDMLYQAYEPMHLPGLRPSEERLSLYGLTPLLKEKSKILDIGSNMGCLGNVLANAGHEVTGVEYNETLVQISNLIKISSNTQRATFIHESFVDFTTETQFNCVLALAVHRWIPMEFKDFISKVSGFLNSGGLFVFESNNYAVLGDEFELEASYIQENGFEKVKSGTTHYECERKYYIYRKI